jgi:hypothetical protein
MTTSVFRDIMPCCPLKVNRWFGRTLRLYLQDWRVSQARNQQESNQESTIKQAASKTLYRAGFLLGLLINLSDGGDMFLRNVAWLSMNSTQPYNPEVRTLHNHRCEKLKSYINCSCIRGFYYGEVWIKDPTVIMASLKLYHTVHNTSNLVFWSVYCIGFSTVQENRLLAAMNIISNNSECLFISMFIIYMDTSAVWRYNSCTELFMDLSVYLWPQYVVVAFSGYNYLCLFVKRRYWHNY